MRAVLDTNVLVSALLSPRGTTAALLRAWREGSFELIVSPALLRELERVMAYPKISARVSESEQEEFVALLAEQALLLEDPGPSPSTRSDDPDDDYLVMLAQSARAVLVSGDKHLLDLAETIPVHPPREFLAMLAT